MCALLYYSNEVFGDKLATGFNSASKKSNTQWAVYDKFGDWAAKIQQTQVFSTPWGRMPVDS